MSVRLLKRTVEVLGSRESGATYTVRPLLSVGGQWVTIIMDRGQYLSVLIIQDGQPRV